jgi:putative peptidoglycan lipid II flippase
LARALRLALLLTIPSTVGLIVLAEPIISVLYQHGKFTAYQASQAAGALRFYAIGLAGYAALKVLVNAFYALDRRKTPMFVSFLAVALNLALNWIFTLRLGWGHRGLAFSTGCIATINFLLLYALMRKHLNGLESRRMLTMLVKVAAAAAVMAGICAAASHWLLGGWQTQPFLSKFAALFAIVMVGAAAFAVCGAALHVEELKELQRALMRRFKRAT